MRCALVLICYSLASTALARSCEDEVGQLSLPLSFPAAQSRPALDQDFPDPMILPGPDGYYYAYATGFANQHGVVRTLSVSRSKDLVHWSDPVEAVAKTPEWARPLTFWGPHAVHANGRYYLFYSAQPPWSSNEKNLFIGVAVSENPLGPFEHVGPLDTGGGPVNIDPMVFKDPVSGKTFMYWGLNGILTVREMRPDLLGFVPESEPVTILKPSPEFSHESTIEAPYVIFENGYYYLFYSGDDCCVQPHYGVMVARSRSPLGPFERLSEQPYSRGDGRILKRNARWLAPGHNSVFRDFNGRWRTAYHALDVDQPQIEGTSFVRRVMLINPLDFRHGWPEISGER